MIKAREQGFDLHANVRIEAGHQEQLERLCRYLARPPISNDRLSWLPDGRVSLRLKTPFKDGTTHLALTPHAFIERLCALIPRPRSHRVRYHGVFAPASPMRSLVVPLGKPEQRDAGVCPATVGMDEMAGTRCETAPSLENSPLVQEKTTDRSQPTMPISTRHGEVDHSSQRRRTRWILWAELMKRSMDLDVLSCPKCHGRMRVISAILQADVVAKILRCLEEKNLEAPIMRPVRAPPAKSDPTTTELVEIDWS